jgi:crotonobetainyl-CoA:carnitine CoA-transferase CaiB-like acyl-CoA transferase
MLADYGADVVKIEKPGAGDLSRTSFPTIRPA